ncbi:MAG: putative Ig domain-containing protein [Luteolibacter sp.]|nr:putative Ig domain-containing protein [Luteolibacter sp.]
MTSSEFVLTTSGIHGTITGGGSYQTSASVTISATPDAGYMFSGWTGDASGTTNPLTFVMNGNKTIGATFTLIAADSDSDGLSDHQEVTVTGTDPQRADTDGDGLIDGLEVNVAHTNPLLADSNSDGMNDAYAFCFVGNPIHPRTGNEVTFDLGKLITAGTALKLSGKLPKGLKFNATSGLLSGVITGNPGTYTAKINVLQGRKVLRSSVFPITVQPFPSGLLGDFESILEDSNSIPIGVCRISIKSAAQWTATLESAGSSMRSAKGTFVVDQEAPTAALVASFSAASGSPQTTVNIVIDGGNPIITGTCNNGTVRGFRLANGAENPPLDLSYNLVLDAGVQDGFTVPAGLGWMKGTVSKKGVAKFKGLLGDGVSSGFNLRLSPAGQAIIWAQPYKNRNSFIGGIITLADTGQTANSNQMLTPGVWWYKDVELASASYPNGFPGMPVTCGTSKWIVPSTASELGASLGWRDNRTTSVTIDGIGISSHPPSGTDEHDDEHDDEHENSSKSTGSTQTTVAVLPTELTMDNQFNLYSSAPAVSNVIAWNGMVESKGGGVTGNLVIRDGASSLGISGTASASGVLVQNDSWGTVTGCGLIKVPITGSKGKFITAAFVLEQ